MKILENTTSVFNANLVDLVRKHLEEKIRHGEIIWLDAYELALDQVVPKLMNGLDLTMQDFTGKIDRVEILEELALAKLFLLILDLEARNIDRILGIHELLRKDDVRTFTDIRRRYLDIVNHSVQEFKTVNVTIENGRIRLFPAISQDFAVRGISTTYFPESLITRAGNDPTPDNVASGTDKGFWETTLYLRGQEPATAVLTLDFIEAISFNRLRINSAGKYPITVSDVQILTSDGYQSIHTGDVTSKFINIVYPNSYQTTRVQLSIQQQSGEFVWWTEVDNRRDLVQDETRDDSMQTSTRKSIEANDFIPIVTTRIDNAYAYTIGAYNIMFYLDIFSGSTDGLFYSRKFTSDDPIETVQLSSEIIEYKPGSSTIAYNVIQQDGSRIPIVPGQKLAITKLFHTVQTLTNGQENWVQLSSAPLEEDIVVTVDGQEAIQVTQFDGTRTLEYLIRGRKLFFNTSVVGKTVTIRYYHKTDYVIIEIILNNGTLENQFDTPSVENFSISLNGVN